MALLAACVYGVVGAVGGAGETGLGVLQHDDRRSAEVRAAGVTHTVLELAWDRFEPSPGRVDPEYVRAVDAVRRQRLAAGFRLSLDLGVQYPPEWVLALPNGKYVNQYGDEYVDARPGHKSANAIFGRAVREALARYVARVRQAFGEDFVLVRLGWGHYGELNYPHPDFGGRRNAYWSFCPAARGAAPDALAEGQRPCPTPGWRPGMASPDGEARRFAEWHVEALRHYHDWQIRLAREHFPRAALGMLYPSWGIRPGQLDAAVAANLSGDTSAERNGEVPRALDFARFIRGVTDGRYVVYVTWMDSDPAFGDDGESGRPEGWSPPHWLSRLAREHPLRFGVWGENTGGGGLPALRLTAERASRHGIDVVHWAFEPQLFGPEPPDLPTFVAAFRATTGD